MKILCVLELKRGLIDLSEYCSEVCPFSENGDNFCRKKKGHKGLHSMIMRWEYKGDD